MSRRTQNKQAALKRKAAKRGKGRRPYKNTHRGHSPPFYLADKPIQTSPQLSLWRRIINKIKSWLK